MSLTRISKTVLNNSSLSGYIIRVNQVFSDVAQTFNSGSTSNTTFYDISGLSVTIIPTSATSNFLIHSVVQIGQHANAFNGYIRIIRDSTAIGTSNSANTGNRAYAGQRAWDSSMSGDYNVAPTPLVWLDSPNTLNSITYKIQVCNTGGSSYPTYINRGANSGYLGAGSWTFGVMSSMIVYEVAGG